MAMKTTPPIQEFAFRTAVSRGFVNSRMQHTILLGRGIRSDIRNDILVAHHCGRSRGPSSWSHGVSLKRRHGHKPLKKGARIGSFISFRKEATNSAEVWLACARQLLIAYFFEIRC